VKKPLIIASTVAALSLAIVGVVAVNNAAAAVTTYTVMLSGANNVAPQATGPDTGSATITIDSVTFQVCVVATINLQQGETVTVNHIHMGTSTQNGNVFVPLGGMSFPSLNSCVTADSATTQAIIADPSGFYYNVHTNLLPLGAARGQLVLQAAGTTTRPTSSTSSSVSPTIATVAPVAAANPSFTG
jgi:CHRD domain-containing protein